MSKITLTVAQIKTIASELEAFKDNHTDHDDVVLEADKNGVIWTVKEKPKLKIENQIFSISDHSL